MRTKRTSKRLALENLEQRQLLTAAAGIAQIDEPAQRFILPYIEQDNLYKAVEQETESSSPLLPAVQKNRAGGGIEVTGSEAEAATLLLPAVQKIQAGGGPRAVDVDAVLTGRVDQASHISSSSDT